MRIALDLLGADRDEAELARYLHELSPDHYRLTLIGSHEPAAIPAVDRFVPVTEFIAQDDDLTTALRRRPDASMRVALDLAARDEVDAVVSAGNTAALMALSRRLVGRVPGLSRPAICKQLTGKDGSVWLLDLGANVNCSGEQLLQFAHLGAALAGAVLDRRPRVALLNIGAELTKAPPAVGRAAQLCEHVPGFDYRGLIEGHELFDGKVDVVVCDGLLGNVALKAAEGTATLVQHILATHLANRPAWIRWLVSRLLGARRLSRFYDPQVYNGASLLGLSRVVVKSHGRADGRGFVAAIGQARREVCEDVPGRVHAALLGRSESR
ncbi:MAG: phosphate acyltransferase [Pseudomonadota bacterium]